MPNILPMIRGERAWTAADRAAGAPALNHQRPDPATSRAHFDAIKNAGPTWAEIDEEAMTEALECLPPIYFRGGFAVSEAVTDNDQGRPIYLCIVTQRAHAHGYPDRHFARYAPIGRDLAAELHAPAVGNPS